MLRDFPLVGPLRTALTAAGTGPRGGGTAEVPIRHAATVMLVRPAAAGGVEVFAFRRRSSLAFAAGMLVFPGGAVEPRDADDDLPWVGPAPATFAAALTADETLARAVVVAAVRETFEECGVLLAGPADGAPTPPLDNPAWEERRNALIAGELTFGRMLQDAGLRLRADLLRPWAHWLTPPGESRRFDTRFFVAALPAGQEARDLGGEGERAAWVVPSEILAGYRDGTVPMLPPTVVSMEELGAAESVDSLLATTRRPRPVSPWLAQADTGGAGGVGGAGEGGASGGGDREPRYVLRIDLDGLGGGEPGPRR